MLTLSAIGALTTSYAESDHESGSLVIFGAATAQRHEAVPMGADMKKTEFDPALTAVYSAQKSPLRLFVEARATDEEVSLERMHLGYEATPTTTLWLGRFHSLAGYWNSQFHHSEYLQPSIHRPAVAEFDEHGGILPSHFVGGELSTLILNDASTLRLEFGAGKGARQAEEGIKSAELYRWSGVGNTLGARLSYSPQAGEPGVFGIFASHNNLPAEGNPAASVRQQVSGVFAHVEQGQIRVLGELYRIHNRSEATGSGSFITGYAHAEYLFEAGWTLYGRLEHTWNDDEPYLSDFHHFERRRRLLGLRFDVTPRQSIKAEYTRADFKTVTSNQYGLQWSFVWP